MAEYNIKFEVSDDWKPLEPACWTECPFACLTKLGHECRARKAYREDKLMICPVMKYGKKKMDFKEAARLINPDTCIEALEEYKRLGKEIAYNAMREACDLACEALKFQDQISLEITQKNVDK